MFCWQTLIAQNIDDFVADAGTELRMCSILRPIDTRNSRLSMHVQIHDEDKENVFEQLQWPSGADVSDWVFERKD